MSLWLGLQYDPYTAFALIYLGYRYARHPERVRETRRIFITDEPQPVGAGPDAAGGTQHTAT